MNVTLYSVSTGALGALYTVPNPGDQCGPGQSWIEGWHDASLFYVSGHPPAATPRPECPVLCDRIQIDADGLDTATLSGIPENTVVSVSGPVEAELVVSDGVLEFTAAIPGDYVLAVRPWPARAKEFFIRAV